MAENHATKRSLALSLVRDSLKSKREMTKFEFGMIQASLAQTEATLELLQEVKLLRAAFEDREADERP